jgi:hypothetical protein
MVAAQKNKQAAITAQRANGHADQGVRINLDQLSA